MLKAVLLKDFELSACDMWKELATDVGMKVLSTAG